MKKVIVIILTTALFLFIGEVNAQKNNDVDASFDQSGFANRLWYGGGFVLGFAGTNGGSSFQLGITPMVGYKILDYLSVGPRIGITYQFLKANAVDEFGSRAVRQVGLTEYTSGIFARLKILQQFFVHVEGEYRSSEFALSRGGLLAYNSMNQEVETVRQSEFNPVAGAGYSSSINSLWGYEIMILYRFNIPENDLRTPFDIRFGFNYNF